MQEWRGGSYGVPEPVSVLTPPSKWVAEPLGWVSCSAAF